MEIKIFNMQFKDVTAEGEYEGKASVFGNVDLGGDIVEDGAFTKTLQEREVFPTFYMHTPLKLVGGASFEQRKKYLHQFGKLNLDSQLGRETLSFMRQKVITEISIGYEAIDSVVEDRNGKRVRILKELKLYETSLLPAGFAMNPKAVVTLVKMRNRLYAPDEGMENNSGPGDAHPTNDNEPPNGHSTDRTIAELKLFLAMKEHEAHKLLGGLSNGR